MVLYINDNDNRCISGVFGWDFNLRTSKHFVTCVRQLNTVRFYFIYFLYDIEGCPQGNHPGKWFSALSPETAVIGVSGKVVYFHYTTVYCACLSVVLVAFRID